jgi:predicted kinase
MKQVIILSGPSGAGKSTYAKYLTDTFYKKDSPYIIETDNIRKELCGDASDQSKNKLVFEVARKRFSNWLEIPFIENDICIIDATNLTFKERSNWYDIITNNFCMKVGKDIKITIIVFFTDLEDCIKRNNERDRVVSADIIKKQMFKLELPNIWEKENCAIECR